MAKTRTQLNAAFSHFLSNMLGISLSVPQADVEETWNKMRSFYIGDAEGINVDDPNNIQGLINVYLLSNRNKYNSIFLINHFS